MEVGGKAVVKTGPGKGGEVEGVVRGMDSYKNISLETSEGTMVIRGDAILTLRAKTD